MQTSSLLISLVCLVLLSLTVVGNVGKISKFHGILLSFLLATLAKLSGHSRRESLATKLDSLSVLSRYIQPKYTRLRALSSILKTKPRLKRLYQRTQSIAIQSSL
ncbi:hypothetical protein R3P38DRAFT_2985769 [Favolaschia claudopus]|uniref:Uncharacterized protein n=1 Tax=Favolaschia claudopus TaxID=2862362 RepID=A0AAW0AUU9_9AGAR